MFSLLYRPAQVFQAASDSVWIAFQFSAYKTSTTTLYQQKKKKNVYTLQFEVGDVFESEITIWCSYRVPEVFLPFVLLKFQPYYVNEGGSFIAGL